MNKANGHLEGDSGLGVRFIPVKDDVSDGHAGDGGGGCLGHIFPEADG